MEREELAPSSCLVPGEIGGGAMVLVLIKIVSQNPENMSQMVCPTARVC